MFRLSHPALISIKNAYLHVKTHNRRFNHLQSQRKTRAMTKIQSRLEDAASFSFLNSFCPANFDSMHINIFTLCYNKNGYSI